MAYCASAGKPWQWYLNDRAAFAVRPPPVPTSNSLLERHCIVTLYFTVAAFLVHLLYPLGPSPSSLTGCFSGCIA
jgi:hypothetical protein